MAIVSSGPLSAGQIAAHFPTTRPAISQHLRVLKDAQILNETRLGTRRLYQLSPTTIENAIQYLREFWPDRLAELKSQSEQEERKRHGKR